MAGPHTKFYLDRQNAKWKGVCAGIADYTGVDLTLVRVGMVMLTVFTQGAMLIAYVATGLIAPKKPIGLYENEEDEKFWQRTRSNPKRTTAEVRSKLRDIDRRLANMETFYTSRNTQLADEIERLR